MKFLHFFNRHLHKLLVLIFVFTFAFVAVYVPQPRETEAWRATLPLQILQLVEDFSTAISSSISAVADPITAAMTSYEWMKSGVLDGLAWNLAKSTVSRMTSSIVNWVNSGFQGSPAFVQDIRGFMLDVGDQVMGEFLQEVGGPLSFVCDPFKLDVKIALAVQYQTARAGQPPGTASCTLSGALSNIEGFLSSTGDFVNDGGWDAWFQITTNPTQYTPFGQMLGAEAALNNRILNARAEELNLLNFGSGFLSARVCEDVPTADGTREDCRITTPGNVISEALNFQLSAGTRSLIEADEINEIVSAVFGQLVEKAVTGSAGLLGLSAGTGFTTPTASGLPIAEELGVAGLAASNPLRLRSLLADSLVLHQNFSADLLSYETQLTAALADPNLSASNRTLVNNALTEITSLKPRSANNSIELSVLIARFDAVLDPQSSDGSAELASIEQDFLSLGLLAQATVAGYVTTWQNILRQTNPISGQGASNPTQLRSELASSLALHQSFSANLVSYENQLITYLADPNLSASNRTAANNALAEIASLKTRSANNSIDLTNLIARFDAITNPHRGAMAVTRIEQDFLDLSLFSQATVNSYVAAWRSILGPTNP